MNSTLMIESLALVPWQVAARTYGNSHGTLAGLLVNWWIGLAPQNNWALEGGGPSTAKKKIPAAAQCDLVLCMRSEPIGVVEVEGAKPETAIERVAQVFEDDREELRSLRFGLLLFYAYRPSGKGDKRKLPPAVKPATMKTIAALSEKHPDKSLVVVTIDREYAPQESGVRSMSENYWGDTQTIEAVLLRSGEEVMRRPYDTSFLTA